MSGEIGKMVGFIQIKMLLIILILMMMGMMNDGWMDEVMMVNNTKSIQLQQQ